MKKILLSTLALTMLIASTAHAMDKPETPSFLQKAKNIAMNIFSEIANTPKNIAINTLEFADKTKNTVVNAPFNFMYKHPFISACLVSPLIPTKIAPFRKLALNVGMKTKTACITAASLFGLTGFIARANLLHIFSHEYLIENTIEHNASDNYFLLNKCECNPKIEKAK